MSRFNIAACLAVVCLLLGATTLLAQGAARAELEGPMSSMSANEGAPGAVPEGDYFYFYEECYTGTCYQQSCLQCCNLEFNRCFNACGSSGSFPLCVMGCENGANECQAYCYWNCS
jgi:hypothetical protein